jgi:hypothetical protein
MILAFLSALLPVDIGTATWLFPTKLSVHMSESERFGIASESGHIAKTNCEMFEFI